MDKNVKWPEMDLEWSNGLKGSSGQTFIYVYKWSSGQNGQSGQEIGMAIVVKWLKGLSGPLVR